MIDEHEVFAVFKGLQFGQAWINVWTRVLGSGSSDTFLRHGVGVKGAVYQKWSDKWRRDGRGRAADEYIVANLDAIRADASSGPGCPGCGTERGLHAPGCEYADEKAVKLRLVRENLDGQRTAVLLFASLGEMGGLSEEDFKGALGEVLATAGPEARSRYDLTLARMQALRSELWELGEEDPPLIRSGDAEGAGPILASMLFRLVMQHAGAFARIGRDSDAAWPAVNDRLEKLSNLSDAERKRMAPACAYIRQMSMFTTGIDELLALEP